ncbi:MAG: hypothetical protein OXI16_13940 [Chloroflexota bacterium]|nr:hypothetical protein [Chloroflexota bacterium]
MSEIEFCRQFFDDLLKDRDPAYITTVDLVEYGYQLALKDFNDYPEVFGALDGHQVKVLDGPFESTVIWQEESDTTHQY